MKTWRDSSRPRQYPRYPCSLPNPAPHCRSRWVQLGPVATSLPVGGDTVAANNECLVRPAQLAPTMGGESPTLQEVQSTTVKHADFFSFFSQTKGRDA